MNDARLVGQPVSVKLPISDWLLFIGWCGAHLTEGTPAMIATSLSRIHEQVRA